MYARNIDIGELVIFSEDWGELGARLAEESGTDQAEFLVRFCRRLFDDIPGWAHQADFLARDVKSGEVTGDGEYDRKAVISVLEEIVENLRRE